MHSTRKRSLGFTGALMLSCILALGIFLRTFTITEPSLSDDAHYAYIAEEVFLGARPYEDFFLSHPPLNFYLTAVSYSVFGVGIAAADLDEDGDIDLLVGPYVYYDESGYDNHSSTFFFFENTGETLTLQ